MKYLLITPILILYLQPVYPQEYITGRIIDRKTGESLAFVNIVYNSRGYGTVSNIEGMFRIEGNPGVEFLKFSYIVLTTKAGSGDLCYKSNYENIDLRTMENGYVETGILVRNILRQWFIGWGLGAFYRYGPYSLSKTIDNFAFKFTITFNIESTPKSNISEKCH
jgi:hypothetical protein